MDGVVFYHASAMLYLHGATLQQLFAPFVLLYAEPRPVYHPVPGADHVRVAVVEPQVLQEVPLPELFTALSGVEA
jgi:hypothetical protein